MIRKEKYLGKQFLPDSLFTSDIFARDYFLIQEISDSIYPPGFHSINPKQFKIQLIHQVLLFHQ